MKKEFSSLTLGLVIPMVLLASFGFQSPQAQGGGGDCTITDASVTPDIQGIGGRVDRGLLLPFVALTLDIGNAGWSADLPGSQPNEPQGGCQAAVARLQRAVTAEAYAYADATRTACQFSSLPVDARSGKPEAINDIMQRKLADARRESAVARGAASGCNLSSVKQPEVYEHSSSSSVDAYIACMGPPASCSGLRGDAFNKCVDADNRRKYSRAPTCQHLLDGLDCTGITVIDRNKKPEPEKETPVTFPNGLNAKCRDAFLQLKAAEKNYDIALKREQELATTFGAAGHRGTELYKRAVADRASASETKYQANLTLERCQASAGGVTSQGPTVKPPAPQERSCNADEAAAFAKIAGSWKGSRVNVTIKGSCEQTSGDVTWAEYCEIIDAPYNKNLPKYTGTFTGRVQGGSLGVTWTQPAAGPHPKTSGTATCSIGSDGLLNCSGFGCAVGAKKQ